MWDTFFELKENYDDPWWRRQRLLSRFVSPVTKILYDRGGFNIMDKEWDNLLIFDACRADMFEEAIDLSYFDSYSRLTSNAENSPEWLRNNFRGRTPADTIYVSANPWIPQVRPEGFFRLIDVFDNIEEYDLQDDVDWEELQTVPAPLMNEIAREAHESYPNKRLIVHYFQPHDPVIGNRDGSVEIDTELEPRQSLVTGQISRAEIWDGYKRNLGYVFQHAKELLTELNGTSVITADHGELLGEYLWPIPIRGYAHPAGVYHPNLLTVPYAVVRSGKRKITEGEMENADFGESTDRLKDLGYLN